MNTYSLETEHIRIVLDFEVSNNIQLRKFTFDAFINEGGYLLKQTNELFEKIWE